MFEGYSNDYAQWINFQNELDQNKNLDDQQFIIIYKEQNPAFAYFFTLEYNYKPYKAQQLIIDKKDAKYAFLFAQNIKNADIKALENVASKDPKWATKFACFVPKANISKFEKIILESNEAQYAHLLIKHLNLSTSLFSKLKKIIISSKKPSYLFELAKHLISKKEISKIEDLIIELKSWTYIRLFAKKIKGSNLEKLERAILDSGNKKEIKKFANDVKKSKLKHLSVLF